MTDLKDLVARLRGVPRALMLRPDADVCRPIHEAADAIERLSGKAEPLIVAKECAERGCCAHDPRIDGKGIVFYPAAPAPDAETAAWMICEPGCEYGPTFGTENAAWSALTKAPPGSELVELVRRKQ